MGSRPTLSLTGFGSSPRRFAARLAAEARRLACGSAYATRPSKLSCSLRISTDTTNLPDPLVISELLEVRAGGRWGLAPRPPGKRLVYFEFILILSEIPGLSQAHWLYQSYQKEEQGGPERD